MQNEGNFKPEEKIRQHVIGELRKFGWPENRLQWKPEWQVPDTPHDLTKRERHQRFKACGSADLVAFADDSGDAHALQIIFEFKESVRRARVHSPQRSVNQSEIVRARAQAVSATKSRVQ